MCIRAEPITLNGERKENFSLNKKATNSTAGMIALPEQAALRTPSTRES
jgi:hypothetical protein